MQRSGRLAEEGETAAVLSAPSSGAGRALVQSRPIVLPPRPPYRPPHAPPVLSAKGIVVERGGRRLVDEASFAVAPGERLALVGGSGAGKTTLMRAVLGLVPRRGEVAVDGVPVTRPDDPRLRAAAQMVFQDPATSFNPRHLRPPIVASPPTAPLSRSVRTGSRRSALRVGLVPDMLAPPATLSGGQSQRIRH